MNKKRCFFAVIIGVMCVGCLIIGYFTKGGDKEQIEETGKISEFSQPEETEYPRVDVMGSQVDYNFEELQDYAKIITKVRVLDDIDESNAIIEEDKEIGILGYASKRKIQILKIYKGQKNIKDEMYVLEPAAVYQKQLLCDEGYIPMEKGKEYILYLGNNTKTGDYSVISGSSGCVSEQNLQDMEEITENVAEITVKSLIKYDNQLSKAQKEKLLQADISVVDTLKTQTKVKINNLDNGKIMCGYQNKKLYICQED